MAALSAMVVMANPETHQLTFGVAVSYNGEIQHFEEDMRPFIIDGRTFLPVRAIADIAGLDVDFDGATNTVLLTSGGTPRTSAGNAPQAGTAARQLTFGVNVSFNGQTQHFEEDMRPFIIDGRTFLPVRTIADIAGLNVDFDGATNTVLLTSGGGATVQAANPLQAMHDVLERFPQTVVNNNAPLQRGDEGNLLRVGISSSMPFDGSFGAGGVFSIGNLDSRVTEPAGLAWSIFSSNDGRAFGETGIATYTVNIEQMYMHITLNEDVLWHDGVPLTLDDLVFAYEIIAHPDYWGVRFTSPMQSIRGIMDYHNGLRDSIRGLVLSNDNRELRIYFDEMPSSHANFGIWSIPAPRHAFDGISVDDMPWSYPVLANPIGWGPFRVTDIVPGEAVFLEAFDNFFLGRPLLDNIIVEIVHPDLIPELMVFGEFDIAEFSVLQFPYHHDGTDYRDATNFQLLSQLSGIYSYVAFRLGHWDWGSQTVVVDPFRPTADIRLRQAMAYAVDQAAIASLWDGLRFPATSIITPIHGRYLDTTLQGFTFDPYRANQLLDEAGFTIRDDEGFRMNQNGETMTLIFGIHEATNNEITALMMIQNWADVGIRVELHYGQMQEFTWFMDDMREDWDGGVVDLMFGNWVYGNNPNPVGMWGAHTQLNFSRFTSPALQQVFDNMESMQMWNDDFRHQQLAEIQRLFNYYSPAIFNNWRINLIAVNNRVVGYTTIISDETTPFGTSQNWHLIGVTAPRPD